MRWKLAVALLAGLATFAALVYISFADYSARGTVVAAMQGENLVYVRIGAYTYELKIPASVQPGQKVTVHFWMGVPKSVRLSDGTQYPVLGWRVVLGVEKMPKVVGR